MEQHYARVRRIVRDLAVDLKLEMDPEMSLIRSHNIGREVKALIREKVAGVSDVVITSIHTRINERSRIEVPCY